MSIARFVTEFSGLFVSPPKIAGERRVSPVDLATRAEQEDFNKYLDSLDVPPLPVSEVTEEKWSEGVPFKRAQFDYRQYVKKFTAK